MSSGRAEFQRLVDARGLLLRALSFEQLGQLDLPSETVNINGREGVISVIVTPIEANKLEVMVQGFLDGRLTPITAVALHGFRRHVSGELSEMAAEDFYGYD